MTLCNDVVGYPTLYDVTTQKNSNLQSVLRFASSKKEVDLRGLRKKALSYVVWTESNSYSPTC